MLIMELASPNQWRGHDKLETVTCSTSCPTACSKGLISSSINFFSARCFVSWVRFSGSTWSYISSFTTSQNLSYFVNTTVTGTEDSKLSVDCLTMIITNHSQVFHPSSTEESSRYLLRGGGHPWSGPQDISFKVSVESQHEQNVTKFTRWHEAFLWCPIFCCDLEWNLGLHWSAWFHRVQSLNYHGG